MRRLLTDEAPTTNPPPIAPPPIQPVLLSQPQPPPGSVIARPATLKPARPPMAEPRISAADRAVDVQLPPLTESTIAYRRASSLHEEVAEHLKRVEEITQRHQAKVPTAHRQAVSAEAARTISMIRHPATARQAIIASLVFGPPKALEGE